MPDAVVHVIDDDDAARESLEFLLRSADFVVTTYDSGTAFLRSLPQIAFGCIITDVRMPDLTGMRLKDLNVKMPVIVVTGHGDVPIAVEAMKLGAADFFEKPFDGDKVVAAVHSAFTESRRDADQEAERKELDDRLATLVADTGPGISDEIASQFSKGWWREIPTKSSPTISASAHERSRSIAPMS
jgi:two-component system, LuxR family, response regulator FixJ